MKLKVAIAIVAAGMMISCRTADGGLRKAPAVAADLFQSTVYNGEPQEVELRVREDAPLVVTYFDSREALEQGTGGTIETPVEAGLYFVLVERPEGSGFAAGQDLVIEFCIERKALRITADSRQETLYDGSAKRVKAEADAPVLLSASYFPSAEARQAATRTDVQPEQRSAALRGFTRVEHSPKEPGTYYVTVYYPGDKNYLPASKEIEFTIKSRFQ
ncbi:hypothetical protein AGMMS50293_19850 [Spirochaetia bacterium]|nr:hypothetical protein AGMMS50293_19850 [Spirochaetia bacterium]